MLAHPLLRWGWGASKGPISKRIAVGLRIEELRISGFKVYAFGVGSC